MPLRRPAFLYPKVSVIMPAYNVAKFIHRALLSVLLQDYPNFELIVIDDCSSDMTPNVVASFAEKDPRVRFFKMNKNGGAAAARNAGLENARGKYIMFCDSDDFFSAGYISVMVEAIERSGADLAQAEIRLAVMSQEEYEKLAYTATVYASRIRRTEVKKFGRAQFMLTNKLLYDKILRRRIVERGGLRFPPLRASEDTCFICSYLAMVDKIAYIKRQLYVHFLRNESIITELGPLSIELLEMDIKALKGAMDFAVERGRVAQAGWISEMYKIKTDLLMKRISDGSAPGSPPPTPAAKPVATAAVAAAGKSKKKMKRLR